MNERITININLMDPEECGCISWDSENVCPHQVAVEKACAEMAQHVAVSIGEITKGNVELKNMYAYLFSHLDMLCDGLTCSASVDFSAEYKEPYAVIYTDKMTDGTWDYAHHG